MEESADDHWNEVEGGGNHADGGEYETSDHGLQHHALGTACNGDSARHSGNIVIHNDHLGAFGSSSGSAVGHGHADIGDGKYRGIVHAVADHHRDRLADCGGAAASRTRRLRTIEPDAIYGIGHRAGGVIRAPGRRGACFRGSLDGGNLVFGEQLGVDLVDADFVRDDFSRGVLIAGKHGELGNTQFVQLGERGFGVGARYISQHDAGDQLPVNGHVGGHFVRL